MRNKYKFILFIVLVSGLLLSLVLNYYFYTRSYLPLFQTRLDPMGLNYYPDLSFKRAAQNPIVMFYGDSRALAWPAPVDSKKKFTFINRAIGNQTSEQVVLRFMQHVGTVKPDVIVIQVCINDLKVIPLFPASEESIIANCKKNLHKLVSLSTELSIKVILTTVYPLGYVTPAHNVLGIKEKPIVDAIEEVNLLIHTLASDNVIIFDSYKLLKGKGKHINSEYSKDWLHLTPKGYEQLNAHMLVEIEKALLL